MKIKGPLVSVEWLKEHLDDPNLIILNASIPIVTDNSESSADLKLIPHTRYFDLKTKFSDVSAPFPSTYPSENQFTQEAQNLGVNKNSAIVVYDDKGIYSSPRVWWLFKSFGHENIAVLDGGLPQWNKAKYPTENYNTFSGDRGDFVAVQDATFMKYFDDVKVEAQNKSSIIIDARSEKRFKGLVDEPRKGLRRGTIPNSVNLPFEALLDGFCLKPIEDLNFLFGKLAHPNDPITFSCGSGITACVLALGAELSGYANISVYDGSWTEWGSLT